jgi:hypothetical protein
LVRVLFSLCGDRKNKSVVLGVRGLGGAFPFARECGDFCTVSLYGDVPFCCLPWLISNGIALSAGGTFFLLRQKETTERKRRPRTIRRCCASVPCVARLPPGAAELATACLRSDSPRPDPSPISATRLTPRGLVNQKHASLRLLESKSIASPCSRKCGSSWERL